MVKQERHVEVCSRLLVQPQEQPLYMVAKTCCARKYAVWQCFV